MPKVDKHTELGRPRSEIDMDMEYHRLLGRDRNPFAFLYNSALRLLDVRMSWTNKCAKVSGVDGELTSLPTFSRK